jgi:hypothetical protein
VTFLCVLCVKSLREHTTINNPLLLVVQSYHPNRTWPSSRGAHFATKDLRLARAPTAKALAPPPPKKKAPRKIRGATKTQKSNRALRLLLRLQNIQGQSQTRLIPIRRILRKRPLPNRLVQIRKCRRCQLFRCSRVAGRQSRAHLPHRRTHVRPVHAVHRRPSLRLPDVLQYRFRLFLMLYRRTLCHSILLRGLFRITKNIRPAAHCQFRRTCCNFSSAPAYHRAGSHAWPIAKIAHTTTPSPAA